MTDITPPPELVKQWWEESNHRQYTASEAEEYVVSMATQYGADQELEACCEWLEDVSCDDPQDTAKEFRATRRPKPLSLKEQAIAALKHAPGPDYPNPITLLTADEHALIRRALEQLPND